jgi:hypothetical protein
MEPEARGIDSSFQPDVVFDVKGTLRLEPIAGKPKDMSAKRSRGSQGGSGCTFLVAFRPVGKLGPFDTYPVAPVAQKD